MHSGVEAPTLAFLSGATADPPSVATSPGADRFGELHIRAGSSSSSENSNPIHTPASASLAKHEPAPGLSSLLAESYNHATTQNGLEAPSPVEHGQTRSDALSNAARGSLHATDSSSPAHSQSASVKQPNQGELQPQGFQHVVDTEKPRPSLSSYRAKPKPPSCHGRETMHRIDKQQSENPGELTHAQWQSLIALHRILSPNEL
ncbi:uncharacterized protein TRUGW13939_09722 [Talaromyces rugulosus]|uniref:Uncharacterized protein n=1 Tax=Talaromyces rugulosus TaxID=121627 RepID=A0A7H8R9Z4_TALRU|nr:uncharacterized protein TRUGW13939_09722 [Talaromyces rugulosus]QKX62561.1 hypothetical protein TRUGW13939_09722 [Talaromyces rugulosus]